MCKKEKRNIFFCSILGLLAGALKITMVKYKMERKTGVDYPVHLAYTLESTMMRKQKGGQPLTIHSIQNRMGKNYRESLGQERSFGGFGMQSSGVEYQVMPVSKACIAPVCHHQGETVQSRSGDRLLSILIQKLLGYPSESFSAFQHSGRKWSLFFLFLFSFCCFF